jgi:hypothetical protein
MIYYPGNKATRISKNQNQGFDFTPINNFLSILEFPKVKGGGWLVFFPKNCDTNKCLTYKTDRFLRLKRLRSSYKDLHYD